MFPTSTVKKIILSVIIVLFIALQLTCFDMLEWTPYNLHWNKYADLIRVKEDQANAEHKTQLLVIPINPMPNAIELRIAPRATN